MTRRGPAAARVSPSALAARLDSLPAAALRPGGTAVPWAAILATAIGPGLLLTGSVRHLDLLPDRPRRRCHAAGLTLPPPILVPVQLIAAVIGLHVTGALP